MKSRRRTCHVLPRNGRFVGDTLGRPRSTRHRTGRECADPTTANEGAGLRTVRGAESFELLVKVLELRIEGSRDPHEGSVFLTESTTTKRASSTSGQPEQLWIHREKGISWFPRPSKAK